MADSAHFMESIRGYTRQQQDQALWEMMTALAGKRFYTAKKLGTFGASYLYPVFQSLGIVPGKQNGVSQPANCGKSPEKAEKN